jgi:hypothetical protein
MTDISKCARIANRLNSMKPNTTPAPNHASPQVTHVTQATHLTDVTPLRPFLCLSLLLALTLPALANLSPDRLRCEYLDNPLGIDTPQPRLSWVLESK